MSYQEYLKTGIGAPTRETVFINTFGDTAEVLRGSSAGYDEYLANYYAEQKAKESAK
jgi:hypothetical protein